MDGEKPPAKSMPQANLAPRDNLLPAIRPASPPFLPHRVPCGVDNPARRLSEGRQPSNVARMSRIKRFLSPEIPEEALRRHLFQCAWRPPG